MHPDEAPLIPSRESEIKLILTQESQAKFSTVGGKEFAKKAILDLFDLLQFQTKSEIDIENFDTYLDTEDRTLLSSLQSCRIRRSGRTFQLTLKQEILRDAGRYERKEYNWDIQEDEINNALDSNGRHAVFNGLRELLPQLKSKSLKPVLWISNHRTKRIVSHEAECYELAFDAFKLVTADGKPKSEEFIEVEIEAKGEIASERLTKIRDHINDRVQGLEFSKQSKYELASALQKKSFNFIDNILRPESRTMKILLALVGIAAIVSAAAAVVSAIKAK